MGLPERAGARTGGWDREQKHTCKFKLRNLLVRAQLTDAKSSQKHKSLANQFNYEGVNCVFSVKRTFSVQLRFCRNLPDVCYKFDKSDMFCRFHFP